MVAQDTIFLGKIKKKIKKMDFFFAVNEIYAFKEWLYEKYCDKKGHQFAN
jgi:hypothetical protein